LWRAPEPLPAPLTKDNLKGRRCAGWKYPARGRLGIGHGRAWFHRRGLLGSEGNAYFSDLGSAKLYKVGVDGKPSVWFEGNPKIRRDEVRPDGRLYAASRDQSVDQRDEKKTIVAIEPRIEAGNGDSDRCLRQMIWWFQKPAGFISPTRKPAR